MKSLIIVYLSLFILTCPQAKQVNCTKKTCEINISQGEQSIFRFQNNVKTISKPNGFKITPVDKKDPDYSVLSILPLPGKKQVKVTFILSNGEVIQTVLNTVKEAQNNFFDLISSNVVTNKNENDDDTALEIIKASIKEKDNHYKKRVITNSNFNTGEEDIKGTLKSILNNGQYSGFIIELCNESSSNTYKIDIRQISIGGSHQKIVAQIDSHTLLPKQKTLLRIAGKFKNINRQIKIPIIH